jgi:hypothetical protein
VRGRFEGIGHAAKIRNGTRRSECTRESRAELSIVFYQGNICIQTPS